MPRPIRLSVLSLCAVALIGAGGCGGSDDSADLTVYSGRDEALVGPLFDRFEKETGKIIEVRYGETAELAATIREEGKDSPADVFFGQDAGSLGALQKDQLLAPLAQKTLGLVPATYRSAEGRWVGTSGRARVIAFDTRELEREEVPASVFDLTDPRWRGKVGWAPTNASFQAFVTGMRALEGDAKAERWLRDMKENDTQVYEKNTLIRDAIAGGEIQLGLINHYYVAQERAKDAGYPVDVVFPKDGDPGGLINVAGAAVLASSEERESAQELVTFLLRDAQQRYFAEETLEYPLVSGVPGPKGTPALSSLAQPDLDLSDLSDLAGTLKMLERTGVL